MVTGKHERGVRRSSVALEVILGAALTISFATISPSAQAQTLTACVHTNGGVKVVANGKCGKKDKLVPVLSSLNGWAVSGNSGTSAGIDFLGTPDSQPLELHSNGARVMRYEPSITNANSNAGPNIVGGDVGNSVTAGTVSTPVEC